MAASNTAPTSDERSARVEVARRAAAGAGARALEAFRARSFDTEIKRDGSPVTSADRAAELLARAMILESFPHDGFVGEEFGELAGESGFRWIVDPIDGTASFARGVPLWGTLVGLEHLGTPIAGVIEMPALGERLSGVIGGGAWHEAAPPASRTRAVVSSTPTLDRALWLTTSHDYFKRSGREPAYHRLLHAAGSSRGWSDCYAFLLLATGRADAVVEPLVKPWDLAALVPIIEEAGGRFSDFEGARSIHSGTCLATNGRLHDELLGVIQGRNGLDGPGSSPISAS